MVGHKPERFSFHQMAARTAGVLLWFCSIYVCLLDIRNKRKKSHFLFVTLRLGCDQVATDAALLT